MRQLFNATEQSVFGEPAGSVELVTKLLGSGSVLDLGAGDGRNALYLAERGFAVRAVDLSEAGIAKLQRLARARGLEVDAEVADAASYRIEESYDVVLIVLLLQFLSEADGLRVLVDIREHTSPGGLNVIHLFTKSGDRQRLDQEEDPQASPCFYPEDGFLGAFYRDWKNIDYISKEAPLMNRFREDGSRMTSVVESIVVRKPMK